MSLSKQQIIAALNEFDDDAEIVIEIPMPKFDENGVKITRWYPPISAHVEQIRHDNGRKLAAITSSNTNFTL